MGFAKKWLELSGHDRTQAVVFFDNDDELHVLDRKGNIERLQSSAYAKQLDVCVVFLAEAHTRGTDLKFPPHYRAAVTLGPNLTKDRLVQGKSAIIFCERISLTLFYSVYENEGSRKGPVNRLLCPW